LNTNTSSCFRAVERAHAAIGFVLHDRLLEFDEALLAGAEQLAHVAPVHAHLGYRPVAHHPRDVAQRLRKKASELALARLAQSEGELAVLDAPSPQTLPSIATL
jgi:hypothetical protein